MQMDLNAPMNTTMTERFNVSGALLVKLFGRTEDEERSFAERADGVRSIGIRHAIYGRTFFARPPGQPSAPPPSIASARCR